jgi:HEAT repeat protein
MAATGLVGGLAPIIVGLVLSLSTGLDRTIDWLVVDSYTPLFVGSFLLLVGALLVIATTPSDARVTTAQFAGMFISGQPLAAMQAMYSHSRGGPEEKRLLAVRRLGRARSPLAADELLEAMEDPSITVRGQALISIAFSKPDARLTDALLEMVEKGSMEMSTAAAWAVGQLHDPRVIEVMLQQLDSPFPMMRARAAISLARLEHRESAPRLLELFHRDELLAPIYGECLGLLRYREAIKPILDCLEKVDDDIHRRSLAYAVAMILGQDNVFLLLLRRMRKNLEGARDEFHYLVRTRMPKIAGDPDHAVQLIDDAFAAARTGDRDTAAELLNKAVAEIDPDRLTEDAWLVINESLPRFQTGGAAAREFAMLVLHAILVGGR